MHWRSLAPNAGVVNIAFSDVVRKGINAVWLI